MMGKWCLHASKFIIDQIFFKLAGNQDRHKISNVFKFWPDQSSHFGVICPWLLKKVTDDIVQGIVLSFLIFMKLADNMSRHKISQVFKNWPEWTTYNGVTCLDFWTDHIWPSGHVGLREAIIALWATCLHLSMYNFLSFCQCSCLW